MIDVELQGEPINRQVINEIIQALQLFITVCKLRLFFSFLGFEGFIFLVNHLLHLMI